MLCGLKIRPKKTPKKTFEHNQGGLILLAQQNKIQKERKQAVINLKNSYIRFKQIYDNGCSDPFWTDGVNINLVRNHIIYEKKVIEELYKENFIDIPDEYYYPTPKELPQNFMAVTRSLVTDGTLTANKTLRYNEVVQFTDEDWKEVLCS